MRRALNYLFLFSLLFELSHPSTNFVRTHVAPEAKGVVLTWDDSAGAAFAISTSSEQAPAQAQAPDGGAGVHSADVVEQIIVNFERRHPVPLPRRQDPPRSARPSSVFQPPKNARV